MFQTILTNLVARVAGARWAMIVGVDGVLLDANCEEMHPKGEILAAEYAAFFRACRKVTVDTEGGDLHGTVLATNRGKTLFQMLTADYFLLMHLAPQANAGKALFEITRTRETLQEELVY